MRVVVSLVQRHLLEQGTGGVEHALDGLLAATLHRNTTSEGRGRWLRLAYRVDG